MSISSASGAGGRDRALSSTVGFALTIALVILGSTAVLALGSVSLTSTQQGVQTERAEKVMTEFDSRSAMVALGDAESQSISLIRGMDGRYVTDPDSGWMRVETSDGGVIRNVSLGSVIYENGDTTIAYQGGGVWRQSHENGSQMVSPPEFHYRNRTLTLPIVVVDGPATTGTRLSVTRNGSVERVYPNASAGRLNPLRNGRVKVTVHSEYYQGWGTYFEERTEGGVEYDHANNQVTVTLLQPAGTRTVNRALEVATDGSGTLVIQSGAGPFRVDNYNASTVPDSQKSAPTTGGGGDVVTTMNVNFNGNSEIGGNLTTAGTVTFGGGMSGVDGNVRYGQGSISSGECSSHVSGWCAKNTSTDPAQNISNQITDRIDEISSSNDNGGEPCFSAGNAAEFGGCGTNEITLEAGDYYASGGPLQVSSGDTLILDTTDGDIRIALDNDRNFDIDGNVTVRGDGRVSVYATSQIDVTGNDAKIWNRGWDAQQFWLYNTPGSEIDVEQDAQFNGVIYSPSDDGTNGDIEIRQQAEVFGAIIAGGGSNAELGQQSEIHFDETLESASVFQRPTLPAVAYLHVTVNRVNISSAG